ncbi:hypothetical protein K491DRAFT_78129 [Lophiostoma macrostomum CBS 122681]|uniref:Uncharacterized protein n=1 Tax=Lophiostoma macrostomum CBS 122681 TaxID=1314788 RepID=A0A6A6TN54_9PLEO|nr:hypothetical protein K491DRAFT_78129 [Lophiostoma macrostomum CBS 122681]
MAGGGKAFSSDGGRIAPGQFPWAPNTRYTVVNNPDVEDISAASDSYDAANPPSYQSRNSSLIHENLGLQKELEKYRKREITWADMEAENARLKKELEQCRKREDSMLAVFLTNFEKEQELSQKQREIEKKETELQVKEERLELQEQAFDDCMHRMNFTGEVSNEDYARLDFEKTGDVQGRELTFAPMEDLSVNLHARGCNVRVNSWKMEVLRAHDYYKGWLNCAWAVSYQEAHQRGLASKEHVAHIYDTKDVRSPLIAGYNVGALFTWSALCYAQNKPDWDMRIDNRLWRTEQFFPPPYLSTLGPSGFWDEVKRGSERAKSNFLDQIMEERMR